MTHSSHGPIQDGFGEVLSSIVRHWQDVAKRRKENCTLVSHKIQTEVNKQKERYVSGVGEGGNVAIDFYFFSNMLPLHVPE